MWAWQATFLEYFNRCRRYRFLQGGDLWWCACRCFVVRMLTDLLLFCVVHSHNLTLNYRRQQHRHHLYSHSYQRCTELWFGPGQGTKTWDTSVADLTVGCGRVSVPVISSKEHVEWEIRNIVALLGNKTGSMTDSRWEVWSSVSMVTQLREKWQQQQCKWIITI